MSKFDWLILGILYAVMLVWLLFLAELAVWFLFGGGVV